MEKTNRDRVSIEGKIIDALFKDDKFYQSVSQLKKSSNFPKYDQWCDAAGFHMEFALAGYSSKDLDVSMDGREIIIKSSQQYDGTLDLEDSDAEIEAKAKIQKGLVIRGIARRRFITKFYISPDFDLYRTKALMKNGLLKLTVPQREDNKPIMIKVSDQED